MQRFVSVLPLSALPDAREAAIASFVEVGVIERCRDSIPGFISGTLLRSKHDPSAACVVVEWRDEHAFEDWMNHPSRGGGEKRLFAPPGRSHLYEVVYEVRR